MAKKKTTETSTKEKKEKKKVDFDPFIKTVIYKETMENMNWIVDVCRKYEGIGEITKEIWDKLNNFVLSVSKQARDWNYQSNCIIDKPYKMATYNISHRVREMQRKKFIIDWSERLIPGDEENNIYVCYQVFGHVAIWLSENSKEEKSSSSKKDNDDSVDSDD